MNKVILMGRLVKDPVITYSQNGKNTCIAKYVLAVDRRKSGNESKADYIMCVAFAKGAEITQEYLHKGMKVLVTGRIEVDSYEKDGVKAYSTNVIVEAQEFIEKLKA
jgi:single-strand DNA-binding protein